MANNRFRYFILTGEPGVGKTTLTKKISSIIANQCKVYGFYTEDVKKNGRREGFDIVTLDGERGRLARDLNLLTNPVKYKVGKYGVLIDEFENIALRSVTRPTDNPPHLLVIDEIGKMEFYSKPFKTVISSIFTSSDCVVFATIPVKARDQLIEHIRHHKQAKVWMVTRENRNIIHEDILQEIKTTLELT